MSRMWLAVVLLLGVSLSPHVRAQTNATSPEGQTRLVLHLSSVPAHDTANILRQVFQGEGQTAPPAVAQLTIVADAVSNSLIFGGPTSAVEEARRLADELDRPAAIIHVEVLIGQAPVDAIKPSPAARQQAGAESRVRVVEKPEKLEILCRARFSTLNEQPADLQMGRRVPRITGTTASPRGTMNAVEYENTGTMIKVRPRVDGDDRIAMQIDVEDSRLGSPEEALIISAPSEGEPIRTPAIETWTIQTSLIVANGQTVVLAAAVESPQTKLERLVLLTARVECIGGPAHD